MSLSLSHCISLTHKKRNMSERTQQPQAAVGSTTVVATPAAEAGEAPVYRVQLQPRVRVTFDESAVDNEHMGRKKSNSEEHACMSDSVCWSTNFDDCCVDRVLHFPQEARVWRELERERRGLV